VQLEAALKGIDRAFQKWHARRRKTRLVNSLAYCAQEVLTAARESGGQAKRPQAAAVFAAGELAAYLLRNAARLREAAGPAQTRVYLESAKSLEQLAERDHADLEGLEQRLTVIEERIAAAAIESSTEEAILDHRRQMERQLAPYRRKMSADQIAMLEKQYLRRRVLETAGLPRLSLFYL